jgi:hypothetical protein
VALRLTPGISGAGDGYKQCMGRVGRRRGDGDATGATRVARRGLWGIARIVSMITGLVVGVIVIGILLVLLEANRDNEVVDFVLNVGEFLVEPFDNVFDMDGRKAKVGVNWGLAAVVYAVVGGLIARLLRR